MFFISICTLLVICILVYLSFEFTKVTVDDIKIRKSVTFLNILTMGYIVVYTVAIAMFAFYLVLVINGYV